RGSYPLPVARVAPHTFDPLAASRSLTLRAAQAVALFVGFYLLAALVVAVLVSLPIFEYWVTHRVLTQLAVFSLGGAWAIACGVAPLIDRFAPPGPRPSRSASSARARSPPRPGRASRTRTAGDTPPRRRRSPRRACTPRAPPAASGRTCPRIRHLLVLRSTRRVRSRRRRRAGLPLRCPRGSGARSPCSSRCWRAPRACQSRCNTPPRRPGSRSSHR